MWFLMNKSRIIPSFLPNLIDFIDFIAFMNEMNRIRIKRHREEDMISLFKQKEGEYIRTITQLQNTINQREKEVESIKDQMLRAIHDLKLENEKLRYYIDLILKKKPIPKKENDYIC